jgi:hypothetical protein
VKLKNIERMREENIQQKDLMKEPKYRQIDKEERLKIRFFSTSNVTALANNQHHHPIHCFLFSSIDHVQGKI